MLSLIVALVYIIHICLASGHYYALWALVFMLIPLLFIWFPEFIARHDTDILVGAEPTEATYYVAICGWLFLLAPGIGYILEHV